MYWSFVSKLACVLEIRRLPHRARPEIERILLGRADGPTMILPVHPVLRGGHAEAFTSVLRDEIVEVVGLVMIETPRVPLRRDGVGLKDHSISSLRETACRKSG